MSKLNDQFGSVIIRLYAIEIQSKNLKAYPKATSTCPKNFLPIDRANEGETLIIISKHVEQCNEDTPTSNSNSANTLEKRPPLGPQPDVPGKLKAMRKELVQMKRKRSQNKEMCFGEFADLNNLLLISSFEDVDNVGTSKKKSKRPNKYLKTPNAKIAKGKKSKKTEVSVPRHEAKNIRDSSKNMSDKGNWKLPPSIPYHVIREKAREKADHAKHQRFLQEPPTSCTKDRRRQMCTKRSENMFHSHLAKLKHRFVFSAYGNY
ncbi:hypothetical protein M9H77_06200 [Catharanthus roseus]|uniref:Uncharacterized protein n=1 Tax=Catharanthus roseus TaxID=4058 RepID=A0ACC0BRF3_CATRO|nr:hypothetical protein M9H77_06200 [Catharanthus roseus]